MTSPKIIAANIVILSPMRRVTMRKCTLLSTSLAIYNASRINTYTNSHLNSRFCSRYM
jgi:hypothetical protein